MRIIYATRAKNFIEKNRGLIGFQKAHALFFKTRFGIHTWGVKFAIDVAILNSHNEVMKIRKNLQPNRLFFWNPLWDAVLELPAGEIKKMKIKIGETIKIIEE